MAVACSAIGIALRVKPVLPDRLPPVQVPLSSAVSWAITVPGDVTFVPVAVLPFLVPGFPNWVLGPDPFSIWLDWVS